ncbi:MAG: hypothetical protein K2X38_12520 [Gemmataceae bacterium]|nr:hypothetical protein [Gemmataceae bacterium]
MKFSEIYPQTADLVKPRSNLRRSQQEKPFAFRENPFGDGEEAGKP